MSKNINAVQLLIDDHNKVKGLFEQFQSAGDTDQKQQIAQQVMAELEVHTAIEEEIFYPAMREQGDAQDKELVAEAYEEHAGAKELILRLRGMTPDDPQFMTLFKELRNDVEHHIQEEEDEMLPKAQEELTGRMDALGEEMLARKQQMMSQMQGMMR